MEVREPSPRYAVEVKHIFAGVTTVPEDWEVVCLGEIAKIFDGTHQTPRYTFHGVPFYSVEQVTSGDFDSTKFISEDEYLRLSRSSCIERGDVLMTRIGSIGDCRLVDWEVRAGYYVSLALLKFRDPSLAAFFEKFSRTDFFKKEVDLHSLAHAIPRKINLGPISRLRIPVPPIAERLPIVQSLADADALIESLSLLLTKKRQIKQGVMHELLTGKKRLPGFAGNWPRKSLGELFQFSGGFSASRDQLSERGHLYLHYGDIHVSTKTFIDVGVESGVIPRLDVGLAKVSPTSLLADGDVVFVDASEDDEGVSKHVVVSNPSGLPFIAGLHTIVAKQRQKLLDRSYLRYCFQTRAVKDQFKFYAVGTKVSGISKRNIARIALPVPPYVEQEAIGELLASIDEELAALEGTLSKARQFKQGMMQSLLTGRIRLVQSASNVIPLPTKPAANPTSIQPVHNWQINEAVIIGVLAQRFGSEQFPLPRKRRVKLTYLLHRHAEGRAEGYLKKAAAPYDPHTKYQGPEQIALKNGYVWALRNEKYEGFVAGDKIDQAQRYFEQWYGTATLEWLERFHYRKTDDLELLTTVDMAMVDLVANGDPAEVTNVKRVIAAHLEWLPKLSRELFSDQRIAAAIAECQTLFGR